MLKIGDFSTLSRISIRMLRHYDSLGLLVPAQTDAFTGYRYYHEDQLKAAGRIAALREMGFGLAAIAEILPHFEEAQVLEHLFARQREALRLQADETAYRLCLIDAALERIRKDEHPMTYQVSLKTLPERTVASVRGVIPCYAREGDLWQTLFAQTAPLSLCDGEPHLLLSIMHDGEYKEENVDVEVQKTVTGHYPDTGRVVFKTMPPIQFASATFTGSYAHIGQVNEAVAAWVRDHGYAFDGVSFNIYHTGPADTPNQDEYVTEVCYPVRKL